MENKLALLKTHAIVANMNIETPKITPQEGHEQPSSMKEKRKIAYAEAIEIFKAHDEAEIEAEQLLFRERIAKNGPEAAVAGMELKIDAAQEQKDKYAEKGDPFNEEAWAVRVQYLTAMKDMLCLYCDMSEKSPELAGYMEEDMPWLQETLDDAEQMVTENREDGKKEASDDYYVDEDHRDAA